MNAQQQAYLYGFYKQAASYGISQQEANELYAKYASELKGDQHKLDVDKDGKIEAGDLKKLRARKKTAADVLTAPGTPDTNIMNSLKGMLSGGSASAAPQAAPVGTGTAAAAPTMNDKILSAIGLNPTGVPASPKGAYGGVMGKAPAAKGTVSSGLRQ